MNLEIISSIRGKPLLVIDNYKYSFQKHLKSSDEKRWSCTNRKCKSFVLTLGESDKVTVIKHEPEHCHDANVERLNRQIVNTSCKRKAADDLFEKPAKIIRRVLQENLPSTITASDFAAIRRNLYNARKRIQSSLSKNTEETLDLQNELEPDMQISTKGEHSGVTKKSKANVDPHFFECQYNAADDGAVASTSRDFTNYDNFSSLEEEDDSYSDVPDFLPDLQPTPVDASVVKIEIEEEPLKIKNEPLIIENDPLTSDTYVEPTLPFIKEEPAEEPDQIALKNVDQLDESERQSIQMFFDSMARTVMNLSPSFVSRIKSEVLRVVSDIEMEANKKKMEQEPSRKTANVIAASDETEPRIEIKNENNEEAEASTKLDEPELLDPELLDLDHDANYEPLAKKKKIEQPSSSLQVHRTPRTLHEPVETFFQSIAYTVKSFPPPFVCKAKVAVLKVISKMEVEACRSHQSGYTDGGGGGDDSSRPDLLPSGSNY